MKVSGRAEMRDRAERSALAVVPRDGCRYEILRSDRLIGAVCVSYNPYHARNAYLELELERYDPAEAKELFSQLRSKLSHPLQVMLDSWEKDKRTFLTAGGFQRKRRCWTMEVCDADLKIPVRNAIPLEESGRGGEAYQMCCSLLYSAYAASHEAVSPLTADLELFCQDLPGTVLFQRGNGGISHFAFVVENEIAYVGTTEPCQFRDFAQTLLFRMLERYGRVSFECDDCDPAAMELKAFFHASNEGSYDTYILS